MNRKDAISKIVKQNRRRSRIRPERWGGAKGNSSFPNNGDILDTSDEHDEELRMRHSKKARLHSRKMEVMKERHNSESTSDEIQSEKEVPSPPVVDDVISEDSSSSTLTRSDRTTLSNRVSLEDRHVLHRTTEYVTSNGHIEEPGPSPGPFNLSHDLEEMVTSDRSASADVSSLDEGTVPPSPEKKLSVEELAKDWLMIQIGHNCSNAVAEKFFHYAVVNCERIKELRDAGELNGLRSLRKKFNHDNVAGVKMDFKYQDKSLSLEERSLNEIDIFNVDAIPRLEYPSDKYNLIYQVAKIEPKELIRIHMESCPHHEQPREVIISVDGVAETKSSRRSLEVVSLQFSGCKEVYPCLIMRPEVDQKRNSKDAFDAYFSVFLGELEAEMIHLDKAVGDAPERANLRKQKLYGGYSSCDLCLANPENIRNERGTGSKRVFRPFMRFSPRRNHDETLQWAEEVAGGHLTEKNGILGKSVLFQVPGFDIVQDLLPEAMHLLDGGFMKNTCGRTFNQGKSPQTRLGYRRAPVEELSKVIRETKFTSDFPRRTRDYDFSNYKCHEWRNMGLFLFPTIVKVLGVGYSHEKSVFLSFGFLNRAVRMPDNEYENLDPEMFDDAENILNEHYEKAYGTTAGSYNYHIVGSHLKELRFHGPLTNYTAYPFEGMYAELRKCYIPGTPNICKQIMQKLLMRKYRGHTHCQNQMKPIRPGSTKKSRDDLLYIFNGDMYTMYMVLDVLPNDNYECVELNTEEKIFTRHPSLNFGKVGIFKNHGLTTIKKIIHISEISGKVISNQNLLFTVPMNVLTQI